MVRDKPSLGRQTVAHDPKDGLSFQIARYLFQIGRYVFQKVGYVLPNSCRWVVKAPSFVNNI
jgi:hypothetical protein